MFVYQKRILDLASLAWIKLDCKHSLSITATKSFFNSPRVKYPLVPFSFLRTHNLSSLS